MSILRALLACVCVIALWTSSARAVPCGDRLDCDAPRDPVATARQQRSARGPRLRIAGGVLVVGGLLATIAGGVLVGRDLGGHPAYCGPSPEACARAATESTTTIPTGMALLGVGGATVGGGIALLAVATAEREQDFAASAARLTFSF